MPVEVGSVDINAASMHFNAVEGHSVLELTNAAIVSDDKGFIWIGTQDGVVRLDGYQAKRFVSDAKNSGSLVSNFIISLAFDRERQKLWIGTSSGLSVLDLKKETFSNYRYDADDNSSLSSNIIQTIYIDKKNRIWLGTQRGLNLYLPESNSFRKFLSEPENEFSLSHNNIQDIKEDDLGRIWVATQSGLNLYQEGNLFKRFYPRDEKNNSIGLITRFVINANNHFWLGTEKNGLFYFEPENLTSKHYFKQPMISSLPSNSISALLLDKEGKLWIGTSNGVAIYDASSQKMMRIVNNEKVVTTIAALYQDENDIIWVGTWSKGLLRYNPNETQIGKLNLEMLGSKGENLKSIIQGKDNNIWFNNRKYVYRMQTDKQRIDKYHLDSINPSNSRVVPIFNQDKEQLYLLINGIYLISDMNHIIEYQLPESLNNISWYSGAFDSLGRLWLASRNAGVYILNADFDKIIHHIDSAVVGYIKQVNDNTMLLGSFDASYWVDLNSFELKIHHPDKVRGMLNPTITGYHVTSDGKIWLGTSGGIHQLLKDSNGKPFYRAWTRKHHLPTDVLTGPLEDGNNKLWFSSTNGLIHFDPKTQSVENYNEGFGAWANYYIAQYLKDKTSRLFFLGPRGISVINESLVRTDKKQYNVIIEQLQVKGEAQSPSSQNRSLLNNAIQYTKSVLLPADKRDFSIGFSTTYIARTKQVKYYYRLIGFDDNWLLSDDKSKHLKYTNLFPGEYRLEIYSISPTGIKSEVTKLNLTIEAFYYETFWFKLLTAIFFFAIFFALYKYRVYKVEYYNQLLEREVEKRTGTIKVLASIGKNIGSLLNVRELVKYLYAHLYQSLEISCLNVGIYDAVNNSIKFESYIEEEGFLPAYNVAMNIETELAAYCIHHNKEIKLKKYSDRFEYIKKIPKSVEEGSMQTTVYFPIKSSNDKILGCLSVQSKKINAYSLDDLNFIRAISNYASIAFDNALTHEKLKKISSTDFLTNLPNRRAFLEQVQYQTKIIERSSGMLTFAMADIDHFKQFNDRYGHDCGDFVLTSIASLLNGNIREQDIVARWGGEEFIFMLPNTDADGALVVLEKIRLLLEKTIFSFQGKSLHVTSTFGICSLEPSIDIDEAINRADHALYRGKENGRNRIEVF